MGLQQENQTLSLSYSTLEKNNSQTQLLLEQIQTNFQEAEKWENEHLGMSIHWQSQYNESEKKLDLKTNQFMDIQAENKILLQQQTEIKQSLKDSQNQNKLLSQEKWELVQEKSQLEGRLKQVQEMIAT